MLQSIIPSHFLKLLIKIELEDDDLETMCLANTLRGENDYLLMDEKEPSPFTNIVNTKKTPLSTPKYNPGKGITPKVYLLLSHKKYFPKICRLFL